MYRTDDLKNTFSERLKASLTTYASESHVPSGVSLLTAAKEGLLIAKDVADRPLLEAMLQNPFQDRHPEYKTEPQAPYAFLRKARLGAFSINEDAIAAKFTRS